MRAIIENADSIMLVSQFTLLEISIKLKLEKLPDFIISIEDITNQFLLDGFTLLPITNHHIFSYQSVPFFENHRDPFDRFLLATALSEQIPVIPVDEKFTLYRPLITIVN